jgi:hypothetical protein
MSRLFEAAAVDMFDTAVSAPGESGWRSCDISIGIL